MLSELKLIWLNSYLRYLTGKLIGFIKRVLPRVRRLFKNSYVFYLYIKIYQFIRKNKYVQMFLNPQQLLNGWYSSMFYKSTTYLTRKIALHIPRSTIRYKNIYVGYFFMFIMLVPEAVWYNVMIIPAFAFIALLFISHHKTTHTGILFATINVMLAVFVAALAFAVPFSAFKSICFLIVAIDFFFLVPFSIRSQEDLNDVLMCIFVSVVIISFIAVIQHRFHMFGYLNGVRAVYLDSTVFSEVMLLMFPFAFAYPLTLESKPRSMLYSLILITFSFFVVTATLSRTAYIIFLVELIIVVFLIGKRYIVALLFLLPSINSLIISNIVRSWQTQARYGNIFENIYNSLLDFWNNGFGVNTQKFVEIYNTTTAVRNTAEATLQAPIMHINAVYFNILIEVGAIFMLLFMWYTVRLAHSSLTSLFMSTQKQRIIFAAGLASLIGISVSTLFESAMMSPRLLVLYWGMLGLLRSGRVIKYGLLDM